MRCKKKEEMIDMIKQQIQVLNKRLKQKQVTDADKNKEILRSGRVDVTGLAVSRHNLNGGRSLI